MASTPMLHASTDADNPWLTAFAPERGITVREPDKASQDYWAGAPSIYYDRVSGVFYLTYRRRHPRGIEPERGYTNILARSNDGIHFDDIWQVDKDQLDTSSMERSSLRRTADGWVLYLSYVDPADNRWRIDAVTASDPAGFDVASRVPVLTAATTGTEGVKDPYPFRVGPAWLLFTSYAAPQTMDSEQRAGAHANGDIYTTGLVTAPTGLATSIDSIHYAWQGSVLPVGGGWDSYQSRLNSIVPSGSGFLGLYDGSASKHENYEERSGVAFSLDLTHWLRLTPDAPQYQSPHGSHSVRYVDAVSIDDGLFLYYEYARPDGAHELRVSVFR